MAGRIKDGAGMIKFEHSVFRVAICVDRALLAARATQHGWPTLRQILWIVDCHGCGAVRGDDHEPHRRSRYDRENPRTKQRALATGALSLDLRRFSPWCGRPIFVRLGS